MQTNGGEGEKENVAWQQPQDQKQLQPHSFRDQEVERKKKGKPADKAGQKTSDCRVPVIFCQLAPLIRNETDQT
jgi:hypothetical protein